MPAISELKYFRMYNRWGEKVFETNVKGRGWNGIYRGKPQPMDVFVWTIEATINGENYKSSGQAALLR